MGVADDRTAVVVITRDRWPSLVRTLEKLRDLPERPPTVVVDNASTDGTADEVARRFPEVGVLRSPVNLGAAGRTEGARSADAPYVAFSDDDSWWAPGALGRAADAFDRDPGLGLIAARILIGPEGRLDPTSRTMARSPLGDGETPEVLGFVACGAVVRRRAFLDAGGFHARYGVGGEEDLLALDLAAAGWKLVYMDAVVAHHHPQPGAGRRPRAVAVPRNDLWTAWLRRPAGAAARRTFEVLRRAPDPITGATAAAAALRGLPWVVAQRRPVPPPVESALRVLGR